MNNFLLCWFFFNFLLLISFIYTWIFFLLCFVLSRKAPFWSTGWSWAPILLPHLPGAGTQAQSLHVVLYSDLKGLFPQAHFDSLFSSQPLFSVKCGCWQSGDSTEHFLFHPMFLLCYFVHIKTLPCEWTILSCLPVPNLPHRGLY